MCMSNLNKQPQKNVFKLKVNFYKNNFNNIKINELTLKMG